MFYSLCIGRAFTFACFVLIIHGLILYIGQGLGHLEMAPPGHTSLAHTTRAHPETVSCSGYWVKLYSVNVVEVSFVVRGLTLNYF